MKITILTLLVCSLALSVSGQDLETQRLRQDVMQHPQQDTVRVNLLNTLAKVNSIQADEQKKLATEALAISQKTHYVIGEGYALLNLSAAQLRQGNRPEAILLVHQADSVAKRTKDEDLSAYVLLGIGELNRLG